MQLLNSSVEKKRKIVADLKRYYMHQKRKSKKKIPMKQKKNVNIATKKK